MEVISRAGTTAQIDPLRFCRWMLGEVRGRGVDVRCSADVVGVVRDGEGVLCGVKVRQGGVESECTLSASWYWLRWWLTCLIVPCSHVVITAGAWSPRVFSTLFPTSTTQIPVSALGGHSLLVRNPLFRPGDGEGEVCHAVFATDTMGFSPELFARTGGEVYLAGLNSTTIALPESVAGFRPSAEAIARLKACARAMMVGVPGREIEVLREGLVCCLPILIWPRVSELCTVLPSSDVEWAAHRIANTRREAGRH